MVRSVVTRLARRSKRARCSCRPEAQGDAERIDQAQRRRTIASNTGCTSARRAADDFQDFRGRVLLLACFERSLGERGALRLLAIERLPQSCDLG
jgi:hypothetical protein